MTSWKRSPCDGVAWPISASRNCCVIAVRTQAYPPWGHLLASFAWCRFGVVAEGGEPRQRPDLRIGQPAGGVLLRDDRQQTQLPRHPHLLAGGAETHAAMPRQPVRGRPHAPLAPPLGVVKLADQA